MMQFCKSCGADLSACSVHTEGDCIEHLRHELEKVRQTRLINWHLTYICAHCGQLAEVPMLAIEVLDSGTILTCDKCGRETVVDLDTREDRAMRYNLAMAERHT